MKTFCKQNTNNLVCFHIYVYFVNLWKYWYYWFLPQQFLYFLPLPHGQKTFILSVLFVFIIFIVISMLLGQGNIHIICIYCTNLYYKYLLSVDKLWTLSTSVHMLWVYIIFFFLSIVQSYFLIDFHQ